MVANNSPSWAQSNQGEQAAGMNKEEEAAHKIENAENTNSSPGKSSMAAKTGSEEEKTKSQASNNELMSALKENVENSKFQSPEQTFNLKNPTQTSTDLDNIHLSTQENNVSLQKSKSQLSRNLEQNKTAGPTITSPKRNHQKRTTESETQKHPTAQLGLKSPRKTKTPQKSKLSPIKIHNTFDPLLKPNKLKAASSSSLGSSSCSGPLFPPGFESEIPTHTKKEQEKKEKEN